MLGSALPCRRVIRCCSGACHMLSSWVPCRYPRGGRFSREIRRFRIYARLAWGLKWVLTMRFEMDFMDRLVRRFRPQRRPRYALALAGGGVIGGMYEVGVVAAME